MAVDQTDNASATAAPTVLDLFSGAGGIAHGFAQCGYRVIGGLDHFQAALNSFESNIKGSRGMLRDLRDPDFTDVREFIGNSGVDVIVGGDRKSVV